MDGVLRCSGLGEWTEWLSAHHAREPFVWLEIRKTGSARPGVRLDEAVEEALRFGWIDNVMRPEGEEGYLLRFGPRKAGSPWALSNRARAEALIAAGRMEPAGLAAVRAAQVNGRWGAAYSSQKSPVVPADLAAALDAAPGARERYERRTNSAKLAATYWVESAKRPETRARRVAAVVARLLAASPDAKGGIL